MAIDSNSTSEAGSRLGAACEVLSGVSETLGMLYVRLQEGRDPESTLIGSMVFMLRRAVDEGIAMVGEADEAMDATGR